MKRLAVCLLIVTGLLPHRVAQAFCGFYVGKADTKLFNKVSRVVLARHDDKTVLTMASDYQGELKEFALVVPVPTVLERDQIHIGDSKVVEHLDNFSAPRLVEYFDPDPCMRPPPELAPMRSSSIPMTAAGAGGAARDKALGVTIEASFSVGEYDILILSAKQSDGLTTWLTENKYRIPRGAKEVLGSYLKQGMHFFVAKVNLVEQAKTGSASLRPLQMAYESPKFMLPIRLGMVNANGPQELFVFALTANGRVETTNYRTVRLATGMDLPVFIKSDFGHFYRDLFGRSVQREDMKATFLEHAWDTGWCDPCAADPLSPDELRSLGVFWTERSPRAAFLTRLHVRYDNAHFPEDLLLQETADRENFQARYVLRHPFTGNTDCANGEAYVKTLATRQSEEATRLAELTGWELRTIHQKMGLGDDAPQGGKKRWYDKIWK